MSSGPRVIHPTFDWVAFWQGTGHDATPGYVYTSPAEGEVFAPEIIAAEEREEEMEIEIRATNSLVVSGVIIDDADEALDRVSDRLDAIRARDGNK